MCGVCDASLLLKKDEKGERSPVLWEKYMRRRPSEEELEANPGLALVNDPGTAEGSEGPAPIRLVFYAVRGDNPEGPARVLVQRRARLPSADAFDAGHSPVYCYDVDDLSSFMVAVGTDVVWWAMSPEARACWTRLDAPNPKGWPKPDYLWCPLPLATIFTGPDWDQMKLAFHRVRDAFPA